MFATHRQLRSRSITDAVVRSAAAQGGHKKESWSLSYYARTTKEERRRCKDTFGRWEQRAKKEKEAWLKKREEKAQARKRAEQAQKEISLRSQLLEQQVAYVLHPKGKRGQTQSYTK